MRNLILATVVAGVCWAPNFVKAGPLFDQCVRDLEQMSRAVDAQIPRVNSTTYVDGGPLARVDLYGQPTPRAQQYKDIYSLPKAAYIRAAQYAVTQKADQCMAIADREGDE